MVTDLVYQLRVWIYPADYMEPLKVYPTEKRKETDLAVSSRALL